LFTYANDALSWRVEASLEARPLHSGFGQSFAAKLVAPDLVSSAVSRSHIEMTRAGAIRFMRFAKKAARTTVLRTFAFMMHCTFPFSGAAFRRADIFGEADS